MGHDKKKGAERAKGDASCAECEINGAAVGRENRIYRGVGAVLRAGRGAAGDVGAVRAVDRQGAGHRYGGVRAIKLGGYFSKDLFRLAFQYDLAFGSLLIAVGIIALCHPGEAMSFLCVMFGIPVLADGLFKIQIAVDARRFGIPQWWLVLALAVLTGVIGLLLVLRPTEGAQALVMLMGVSLLLDGALNLSVALCAVKVVRHQQPDIIETDDFEIE